MARSLRGRLVTLLLLLIVAAAAAAALMFGLFRQSAAAQAGQAEAEIGRACEAIQSAYHSLSSNWRGPSRGSNADEQLSEDLTPVVRTALKNRPGVEGGIRLGGDQRLAYAFPTYQGGGPKTDEPAAELPRIGSVNREALAQGGSVLRHYEASSQILLIAACPLSGPIPGLTGWAMTRVFTFAGDSYRLLMAGIGVLLAAVLGAAALLTRLTLSWSRHVGRIEAALKTHQVSALPTLPMTGERELDRIVTALNDAGERLALSRQRADDLARRLAVGERLAAIGRLTAGVAHEFRNPISAMRLKAEGGISGDAARKDQALSSILGQVDRLDDLLRRLLSVTAREETRNVAVKLAPFLEACASAHRELASAKGLAAEWRADVDEWQFDPNQMRNALDNLVLNAIEAAPANSVIVLGAKRDGDSLILSVHDDGAGPPAEVRERLFEPFVTGRADGIGLGLSIAREIAGAHGGVARLAERGVGTTFEIVLPCRPS
jgi:signal transduction histidine kinase/type II secretory pathway pseudopilin PulG